MRPSLDELLALDLLTLRAHTELAGDVLQADLQRECLKRSLNDSEVLSVRRQGELVAYAMVRPESNACWFVGAFSTHPHHRTSTVVSELLAKMVNLAHEHGIEELKSHVYKTNRLSLAFHRKLGFRITRENEKAVEFVASISTLSERPAVQRAAWRAEQL